MTARSKSGVLIAAAILCAVTALSQPAAWKEYVYGSDGFAISTPSEPEFQKQIMKPVAGEVEAHFYLVPLTNAQYMVMYAPLHPNDKRITEQALAATRDGIVLSGAKLVFEKKISLGEYPGIELEAESGQYHQRARFYVIDRKIYTLAVTAPEGTPFPTAMSRWYESFRLLRPQK
jgi:hypothetical protein